MLRPASRLCMRVGAGVCVTLCAWLAVPTFAQPQAIPANPIERAPRRPNLLLIITDDQRTGSVGEFMPQTQARIFDAGVTFTSAYVTTPLCGPSRASILSGRYAHNHGTIRNTSPFNAPTFVEHLHDAGYYTGIAGKYGNTWSGAPRAEFDYWISHAPNNLPYYNPTLNVNGVWSPHTGYTTEIMGDYACAFLDEALSREQPFLFILSARAPHLPAIPAPGDELLYPDLPPNRPPNFNEKDVSDKPEWFERISLLAPDNIAQVDAVHRLQLQSLASLDDSIGHMLDQLEQADRLHDTVIVFLSDNGIFLGEHRLMYSKERVYETVTRVPMAMRYSRAIPAGDAHAGLVANIDIAPTFLALAGLPIPQTMDGLALNRLLSGDEQRDALLLEGWPDGQAFTAIHTGDMVYVETPGFSAELYDLLNDPYQLDNRASDPAYTEIRELLANQITDLLQ